MRADRVSPLDIGLVALAAYDANGFIGVQVDGYGEEDAAIPMGEPHFPMGVLAFPLDPVRDTYGQADPARSCASIYFWEGGRLHTIPAGDPRLLRQLPRLAKGSAVLYGGTEAAVSTVIVDAASMKVRLGLHGATEPVAKANPMLEILKLLDIALEGVAAATTVPATPFVTQYKAASAAFRELLAATLVEVT